jgi:uncharacterized radical SAM superfamily Fe-S cluster-containing enzyme
MVESNNKNQLVPIQKTHDVDYTLEIKNLKLKTECLLQSFKRMKSIETNHEEFVKLVGCVEAVELILGFITDVDNRGLVN